MFSRTDPTAAQRFIQINLRQQQVVFHLYHAGLHREQRALRIELIQIRRVSVAVAVLRNPQRLLRDRLLCQQLGKLFLIAGDGIKAVIHLSKRVTHGFFVAIQRLIPLGLRDIYLRIQRLTVQQRRRILPPTLQSCSGLSSNPDSVRSCTDPVAVRLIDGSRLARDAASVASAAIS